MVLRQQQQLFETRWDGNEKSVNEIDPQQSHIWSSVTLYSNEVIKKRKEWFSAFISNHEELNENKILNFHRFAGDGDETNDVLMNRNNELFTVSITLLHQQNKISKLHYVDLLSKDVFVKETRHTSSVTTLHETA